MIILANDNFGRKITLDMVGVDAIYTVFDLSGTQVFTVTVHNMIDPTHANVYEIINGMGPIVTQNNN